MIDPLNPKGLRAAREKAHLTREQLAKAADVNKTTIWRIETGEVDPVSSAWRRIIKVMEKFK